MTLDHSTQDATAPQSEPERSFWSYRDKFPPAIEAAFQAEMDRIRERRIHKTGLTAIVLYSLFAITDKVMVPDVYLQAWAVRFLLVVPFLLVTTFSVYKLRRPLAREILLSAALMVSGASMPGIATMSSHPNAAHFQTGLTLILMFGNIVLNLRFRSALITSILMTLLYGLVLTRFDDMTPAVKFNSWMFCLAAVAISLIANFRTDQDQRRAYLARMREVERNEELRHAVELLSKISAEDELTKIANRREFDHRLNLEWSRAQREARPLALILADVDFFKNYNDTYGHPAGDVCLQKIAAALRSVPKRPTDLVARFGGEEFVALLPGVPAEDAAVIAERMRQAILDLQIPHAASRVAPGVTASFGVAATLPGAQDNQADLVATADAALYRAKARGRNRVAVQEAQGR